MSEEEEREEDEEEDEEGEKEEVKEEDEVEEEMRREVTKRHEKMRIMMSVIGRRGEIEQVKLEEAEEGAGTETGSKKGTWTWTGKGGRQAGSTCRRR